MNANELISRREADVLHLQLNRPDKGNALSGTLVLALTEAMDVAVRDASLRLPAPDSTTRFSIRSHSAMSA